MRAPRYDMMLDAIKAWPEFRTRSVPLRRSGSCV
jgi:hypothetical protein